VVVVARGGCAMEILAKVHLAEHALRLALIKLLPAVVQFGSVRWFSGASEGGSIDRWCRR